MGEPAHVERAHEIVAEAVKAHEPSHLFALFSGGHESLSALHVASQHPTFTAAVHVNTGTGIPETREFVLDTCEREGWPLIELHPDGKTYEELVLDKGFPRGPKSHNVMYYWLKQRQFRRLVREHKTHRYDRIGLVTGARAKESGRRMRSDLNTEVRREGAQLWINPIVAWSAVQVGEYIERAGLKRNEVVDTLHRSGECLCGALANHREIEEIEAWYPDHAEWIHELERRCEQKGLVDCRWAYPSQAPGRTWDEVHPSEVDLQLCTSCISREFKPTPPIRADATAHHEGASPDG